MLILMRLPGQKIIIGDKEITVKVLGVDNRHVRFGLDADKDKHKIYREELYQQYKTKEPPQLE